MKPKVKLNEINFFLIIFIRNNIFLFSSSFLIQFIMNLFPMIFKKFGILTEKKTTHTYIDHKEITRYYSNVKKPTGGEVVREAGC